VRPNAVNELKELFTLKIDITEGYGVLANLDERDISNVAHVQLLYGIIDPSATSR
jgi:hypothetical protein